MPPVLTEPVITDVTDRSFSLVWTADQPGQPIVEIYSDAAGALPVTGITLDPYPVHTGNPVFDELSRQPSIDAIRTAAKSIGVIKVTVSGLNPATDYYIKHGLQTDSTLETTLCPDAGPTFCPDANAGLLSFTTEQLPTRTTAVPDLYVNDVLLRLDATAQTGELVIAAAETSNYPVSAFVGDGVSAPYTVLDLNNLYATATNTSLKMVGSNAQAYGNIGEGLVVRHYKGINGSETMLHAANTQSNTGALMAPLDRKPGDCNSDGTINGYDHLLLSNAVAGALTAPDYTTVAFHPVLCNLYKEAGLHDISTTIVLDNEDQSRHTDLLTGKTPVTSLPEAP